MTRRSRSRRSRSIFRAVPSLLYRVEAKGLVMPNGAPGKGVKTLAEAKRFAKELILRGESEAKIIENKTGIVVARYDRSLIEKTG